MEVDKVKELIELMKQNDLCELEIVDGQTRIALKRGAGGMVSPVVIPSGIMAPVPAGLSAGIPSPAPSAPAETPDHAKLVPIPSPMVGTFYAAASPTVPPFVKVGSQMNEATVVCIIEAMKVMNEVKAEIKGTLRKILVENGAAVEFGQPLFLVEPD